MRSTIELLSKAETYITLAQEHANEFNRTAREAYDRCIEDRTHSAFLQLSYALADTRIIAQHLKALFLVSDKLRTKLGYATLYHSTNPQFMMFERDGLELYPARPDYTLLLSMCPDFKDYV